MYNKKANIGEIDMEFVRQVLNDNVTVTNGKVICPIPGENYSLNIGKCSYAGTYIAIDINLVVQEDELLGIRSTLLDPKILINTKNVYADGDKYYLRCDGLLLYIGDVSRTVMHLNIPAACTERSFKAKKQRDKSH